MTTYTASTNVEKIRKSKPSLFDNISEEKREKNSWKARHHAKRLFNKFQEKQNELN